MTKRRSCSAIIFDGKIAMVYNKELHREYWTLPGGGVENNESLEETAIREAFEEANLEIKIIRLLYKKELSNIIEHCFLAEPLNAEKINPGYNPEGIEHGIIEKAEWKNINDVIKDIQISLVMKKLTTNEIIKYGINLI